MTLPSDISWHILMILQSVDEESGLPHLALKFTDYADADKIMVGLVPSAGSGLVALDEDMNAVFKITDKTKQVLVVDTYKDEDVVRQTFTLSGLTLATS